VDDDTPTPPRPSGSPGVPVPLRPLVPLRPDAPRHVPDAPRPAYRFLGDLHPHPRRDPRGSLFGAPEHAPGLPAARWREDRSFLLGIDLYHEGFLWEAHEAWEACFFASGDPAHRDLLQALIQLAAAEIQAHRGVRRGAEILAAKVLRRLANAAATLAPGARLAGLDPAALHGAVAARFAPTLAGCGATLVAGLPVALETAG
jgi:hypothetical protein